MLEDGKYRAKAKEWSIGEAGTGTAQVVVFFDLLDHEGEGRTWYGFLSDAALKRTIESLRHMGWQGCDISELSSPAAGLDSNEVQLVLESEDYNGKVSQKVRWVNKLGTGKPMEEDSLKALSAKLKGKILALDPGAAGEVAAARPKPTSPGNASIAPDDIPF
jgi:hypothetical protein